MCPCFTSRPTSAAVNLPFRNLSVRLQLGLMRRTDRDRGADGTLAPDVIILRATILDASDRRHCSRQRRISPRALNLLVTLRRARAQILRNPLERGIMLTQQAQDALIGIVYASSIGLSRQFSELAIDFLGLFRA
jgi:hypothetical protein